MNTPEQSIPALPQSNRAFYGAMFAIAVPIMIQGLMNSLVNMADTVMISRLGTTELAAAGLGNQVFFLLNMFLFGITSGASVFSAQFWGRGDIAGVRKTTGMALALVLPLSAVFTVAGVVFPSRVLGLYTQDAEVITEGARYLSLMALSFIPFGISFTFIIILRTIRKVRLAMTATLVSLSLNVLLNYLLIFGAGPIPRLGIAGAGLATVLSRLVELAIVLVITYAKGYAPAGTVREFSAVDRLFIKGFLRIAMPVFANEVLWSVGITMQSVIFARSGTENIAAFNITVTVSQLVWVVFIGLGNSAAVLIGNNIGAGDEAAARKAAQKTTFFNPLAAAAVGLLLIPLSALIPVLFNASPGVLGSARIMLMIMALLYPFRSFNMTMVVGVCRAGGDTIFCAFYDVLFLWALALPLAAFLVYLSNPPAWLIFVTMASEEPAKAVLGWWRLRSGRWLRRVV